MSQSEFTKSFKDFCPRCEHLDYVTGFCYKIREKVDRLPVKFGELCNGEYFSLERNSEFLQAKSQYVQKYATAHKEETIVQETVIEKQENPEVQTRQSSLKANKRIVDENVCSSCQGRFTIGENIDKCEKCGSFYHSKCWELNKGCNQASCKENNTETHYCQFCGKEIKKDALKCKHCGAILDQTVREKLTTTLKGTVKEASDSLTYAIIGIFCCGIILGPIAVSKGMKALQIIENDPGYVGKGRAITGIVIGSLEILLFIIGVLIRLSNLN